MDRETFRFIVLWLGFCYFYVFFIMPLIGCSVPTAPIVKSIEQRPSVPDYVYIIPKEYRMK